MAVKCPKCGKPNPDEAYICQYCDAPLVIYTPPQIPQEPLEPIAPLVQPTEFVTPAAEPIGELPMDENHPDWLEHLRKKKEEDSQKLGEDFFNRFGPVNTEEVKPDGEPGRNLDDWLNRIRSTKEADGSQPPIEAVPAEEDTIPTWLSAIRTKAVEEGLIEQEPEPTPQSEDWLNKLRGQGEAARPLQPEDQVWMPGLEPVEPVEAPIINARDLSEVTSDEPAFLKHLNDLPAYAEPLETHEENYSAYYDIDIPEEVEHPIPEMLRNSIPHIEADAFTEDILPPEEQMLEMQDEPRERIPSKDIPKWLTSILGENEEEAAPLSAVGAVQPEPEQPPEENVEPGAIPGWVQAMRPLERVDAPPESDHLQPSPEASGPLAGIRGILSGDGLMTSYTRVDGIGQGVRDKAKTAEHVALFNEILATEKQEIKVPGMQRGKTIGTVRWLMMALLLAIMLMPIINGTSASSLPGSIPRETISLFKSITALPADSKVVIAIDYEPAYAGELQAAASSVLNHLMVKQSNLYVISTTPAGPMLASQLMDAIGLYPQTFQQPYTSGEKYHILGYLPGGEAGIQALNQSLTSVIPLTIGLEQTRDINGLGGPAPLSSFDAVLIISDQPDSVRNWIEQIQQTDGKPALWAVVNAQSAPMLRPYVRSGQLEGLSAGEYGGTLYERIFQQPGVAWRHWNTFHTGVLAAVVLILLGGVLNYAGQYILRNRRKKSA